MCRCEPRYLSRNRKDRMHHSLACNVLIEKRRTYNSFFPGPIQCTQTKLLRTGSRRQHNKEPCIFITPLLCFPISLHLCYLLHHSGSEGRKLSWSRDPAVASESLECHFRSVLLCIVDIVVDEASFARVMARDSDG